MLKTAMLAILFLSATLVLAQSGGSQAVQGVGTINQMSATPDQNQQLTGQRPYSNTGGPVGDMPDTTDRVSGRAYPVASGVTGTASASQGPGSATDPRNARATDAAMLKAAQAAKSGANPPGSLNPAEAPHKSASPSPGAKAQTKSTTGTQTNDKSKRQ